MRRRPSWTGLVLPAEQVGIAFDAHQRRCEKVDADAQVAVELEEAVFSGVASRQRARLVLAVMPVRQVGKPGYCVGSSPVEDGFNTLP